MHLIQVGHCHSEYDPFQNGGRKQIKKELSNIQSLIERLKENSIMGKKPSNDLENKMSELLENAKNALEGCQSLITENLVDPLENLKALCEGHLKNLENNSDNIDNVLKEIIKNFTKDFDQNIKLFKKAFDKIKNLQNKITRQNPLFIEPNKSTEEIKKDLICKLDNLAPENVISKTFQNPLEKNLKRISKSDQLTTACLKSLVQFKDLEDTIEISVFKLTILSEIESLNKLLRDQKSSISSDLNKINRLTLDEDFEKYTNTNYFYKSDLQIISDKIKKFDVLKELNLTINDINKRKEKILPALKESISKIEERISSYGNRYEEVIDIFNDNNQLLTQRENSIKNLKKLHSEISKQWNEFCLDLYEIEHQKIKFNTSIPLNKKMKWVFKLAEYIQGHLYNLRRKQTDRNILQQTFKNFDYLYSILSKFCAYTDREIADHQESNENLMKSPFNVFNLQNMASIPLSSAPLPPQNTLKDHHDDAIKALEIANHSLNDCSDLKKLAETLGLILTKENKKEILELFKQKRLNLTQDINKEISEITSAFKAKLPQMCSLAASEINKFINDLKLTRSYNDHEDFTKIFTLKPSLLQPEKLKPSSEDSETKLTF